MGQCDRHGALIFWSNTILDVSVKTFFFLMKLTLKSVNSDKAGYPSYVDWPHLVS